MTFDHHVILDTDIGSDVDDALALALLVGTPTAELLGVTTNYGDTLLRARLAARIAGTAGWAGPVHAGLSETLSGKEVWWAGHEGKLFDDLDTETVASEDAVRYLVDQVVAAPGTIDVVAIGPLTNIAAAIGLDDRFAASVKHLYVMGGAFGEDEPEHNIRSDVDAARIVFGAGIPTTVSALEVTRLVRIEEEALARIATAGDLGHILLAEIEQWWRYWDATWNVPHDPVTVLTMTDPDLFDYSPQGRISVADDGATTFDEGDGATRIVIGLDGVGVADRIVAGIIAAGTAASEPAR
ncbi:nucleoside hydrolase [Frigoribacterium sp. 2-23]|uniref:nucleoside hydrolase n=1 Tax=Frigoribacterium sp. 2-23 TaxID=3415006 RepID=UPI003C6FB1BF